MPRPALTEAVVEKQRSRALRVALESFAERGLEAVTFRAIATGVGLSPMALYRYFPGGRAEILATIRGSGFEELADELAKGAAGAEDAIEQILCMTATLIRFATRRPDLYLLMFTLTQAEEGQAYLATRRERAWRQATSPFQAAIAARLLRGDPEVVPHLFFAAIHGAIVFELSAQPDPRRRIGKLIGPLVEMLLRGAGARPATIRRVRRTFPASARLTQKRITSKELS